MCDRLVGGEGNIEGAEGKRRGSQRGLGVSLINRLGFKPKAKSESQLKLTGLRIMALT
ncbi:hypothetical protein MC7420_233 [Coleofasciculus chthonoplastes PCC 7420]|uniref:Uncharacterized protein n=1 Tax=Coleofasciculus chthonoplastes PCC 7420 TaxID=118168 RepID=B4VKS9_9CYAN|nr:hypothetical protein MC7420_233 [Coleofasciculus chthonoplastes PCC 7420]